MTTTAEPESTAAVSAEHPENPRKTGYTLSQLAEFIETTSAFWQERDKVSVQLLRALCRLVRQRPEQALDGFTALELAEELRAERPQWPTGMDKTEASKKIAKPWEELRTLFDGKLEHLAEQRRSDGHDSTAGLDKSVGGGQGHTSRYRLYPVPLAVDDHPPPVPRAEPAREQQPAPGEIRYAPIDSAQLRGWSARLAAGVEMKGGFRHLFLAAAMLTFLGLLAGIVIVVLHSLTSRPWQDKLGVALFAASAAAFVYSVFLPPLRVSIERILKAPFWLQGFDDNWLLEFRSPPLHARKSMHRVRYAGICPLCGGHVEVNARAWWRPANELIGRCENAPVAHRYSFDHVLRIGCRL